MEETKKLLKEKTALEKELMQEMAEALGHAGFLLEDALRRLQSLGEDLDRRLEQISGWLEGKHAFQGSGKIGPDDLMVIKEYHKDIDRYNALREKAITRFRHLVIQREAVGFRKHDHMHEKYPIPPKRQKPFESYLSGQGPKLAARGKIPGGRR